MLKRAIRLIHRKSRDPGGWVYFTSHWIIHNDIADRRQRGIHNIENELIFRSNKKLVFHDSQGFEAGREDEFLEMKKFIADRAETTILKKRIHAIWQVGWL